MIHRKGLFGCQVLTNGQFEYVSNYDQQISCNCEKTTVAFFWNKNPITRELSQKKDGLVLDNVQFTRRRITLDANQKLMLCSKCLF